MGVSKTELQLILSARDQASKELKNIQTQIGGLVKGLIGAGGAVIAFKTLENAAKQAVQVVGQLGVRGGEVERLSAGFHELAGAAGNEMLAAMRTASAGTISNYNLMLSANKALMLGVADSADELGEILEIARFRGKKLGLDATQAFNDIITGIGRMSPLILDNLGIVVDQAAAQEQYAASVGKTVQQLSEAEKKQALTNAVIAEGRTQIEAAGGVAADSADGMERLRATMENLRDEVGTRLAPAFGDAANQIVALTERAGPALIAFLDTQIRSLTQLPTFWADLAGAVKDATADMGDLKAELDLSDVNLGAIIAEITRQLALFGLEGIATGRNIGIVYRGMGDAVEAFGDLQMTVIAALIEQLMAFVTALAGVGQALAGLANRDPTEIAVGTAKAMAAWVSNDERVVAAAGRIADAWDATRAPLQRMNADLAESQDAYDKARAAIEAVGNAPQRAADERERLIAEYGEDPAMLAMILGEDGQVVAATEAVIGDVVEAWEAGGKGISDSLKKAFSEATGYAKRFIDDAIGAAKKLFDLGGDKFGEPGSGGPFENLFRILDVAKLGGASPWAAQLGLTQEDARRISADFQAGLLTPEVLSFVDQGALVDRVRLAGAAEATQAAFAEEIARAAGVNPVDAATIMGFGGGTAGPSPTGGEGGGAGPLAGVSPVSELLGRVNTDMAAREEDIAAAGERFWHAYVTGGLSKLGPASLTAFVEVVTELVIKRIGVINWAGGGATP